MNLDTIKSAVQIKLDTEIKNSNRFGWDNPVYSGLETPVRAVMSAYQNANRWLDSVKEHILINLNLPYFSHIVHELAHTMPERFDQFGRILHKENLSIPYPGTEEWSNPCGDIKNCINIIYDILDQIKLELLAFKSVADNAGFSHMSIECDTLLNSIQNEYEFYYRAEGMLENCNNLMAWDKQVFEYFSQRNNLI